MKKQIIGLLLGAALTASAAVTWNDGYGMGNRAGNWGFNGSGYNVGIVGSVVSNTLAYITSAYTAGDPGEPRYNAIWIKPDLTGCTLDFYVATNYWIVASNAATISGVSSNIIWLTTTNAMMATNDVLVHRDVANDCYQVTLVSGNATDAYGTVYTNASGYVGIKIFHTLTNVPVAGDYLYKMSKVASHTPLSMQNVTNDVAAPWGQWWQVATRAAPIGFKGKLGWPSAVMLTYSNAAGLYVEGEYYVRQRR